MPNGTYPLLEPRQSGRPGTLDTPHLIGPPQSPWPVETDLCFQARRRFLKRGLLLDLSIFEDAPRNEGLWFLRMPGGIHNEFMSKETPLAVCNCWLCSPMP